MYKIRGRRPCICYDPVRCNCIGVVRECKGGVGEGVQNCFKVNICIILSLWANKSLLLLPSCTPTPSVCCISSLLYHSPFNIPTSHHDVQCRERRSIILVRLFIIQSVYIYISDQFFRLIIPRTDLIIQLFPNSLAIARLFYLTECSQQVLKI